MFSGGRWANIDKEPWSTQTHFEWLMGNFKHPSDVMKSYFICVFLTQTFMQNRAYMKNNKYVYPNHLSYFSNALAYFVPN